MLQTQILQNVKIQLHEQKHNSIYAQKVINNGHQEGRLLGYNNKSLAKLLSGTNSIGPSFYVHFKALFAINPFSEEQQALGGADAVVNWQFY